MVSAVLPNDITKVGAMSFDGCRSLTDVTIPSSVTSIGLQAFQDCCSLTTFNIPDGVTEIGLGAFRSCSSLSSVNIPDGVTAIGEDAFYGCTSLSSIIIPSSVSTIGKYAFRDCYSLTQIQSNIENPMPIPNDVFPFFTPNGDGTTTFLYLTLYVPIGCKEKYQETEGWNRYNINIVEGTIDASAVKAISADEQSHTAYSLSGQRLAAPRKGINIVGGRKVVK